MKKFVPLLILAAVLFALLGCPSEPKQPKTKTFKVSYVSEYGPAPEQKTVKENYALTQADLAPLSSETAANAHKVFQGWFIDSSIPANPGDKITRNTTLVARWKSQQFTVTYTTLYGTAPDSITLDYGTALTAEELPVLQNDSHTFTGWFANGIEVKTGFAVKENLTLAASWDKTKRTVSFIDEKHPGINPITVLHGETASLPAPADVPGYDFKGWFAGATQITSSTPITSDITLTAKWQIQRFTVTYATSYGTAPDSITLDYGTALTAAQLPALQNDSHTFTGWFANGIEVKTGFAVKENLTLTANWDKTKRTVSFIDEKHPDTNPITVLHGETASLSAPANVPGYDFKGWFAGATQITSSTPITSDITLTAKWQIQRFTVTYATSYGTAPDSITVDYGTPLTAEQLPTLSAPAEEHIQHNGWTSDGTTICKAGDLITENKVLTAKWGPEQLKLTVSTSVEGFPESIDVNFGSKIKDVISSEELNPTLQHYELLGWKIDDDFYPLTYAEDAIIESPKTAVPQFKIKDNAFQSSTITEYTVPKGVREIGAYAFAGSKIASISIPNSVTSIGAGAFYNCSKLTTINIPASLTSIPESAFNNCSSLTSITIPTTVSSIGTSAFEHCSGLTGLIIPNTVTTIQDYAFGSCSGLTEVVLGEKVETIHYNAFNGSTNIKKLVINGSIVSLPNRALLEEVVIGDSVTSIPDYAFDDCSKLKTVTIGNSVTSIGEEAFIRCSELSSINIPNSVTSIGPGAFSGCSGLTSINIPNSVTSIKEGAFDGCSGLTSITIPRSVTSIEQDVFWGCSGLTNVIIPDSVTSIGAGAFDSCSRLTSITIPDSVTSIGESAFGGCSGLTSITIPNSVTSIGRSAFRNCSGLTSVTVGNSVTSIPEQAFFNCSELTTVTFLNSDSRLFIEENTFHYCSKLSTINCAGADGQFCTVIRGAYYPSDVWNERGLNRKIKINYNYVPN